MLSRLGEFNNMFDPVLTKQKESDRFDLDWTIIECNEVVCVTRCCISCRESRFNCFSCFIFWQGKDGFLGRCVISPMVRLEGHQTPEPRLQWHKIRRGEEEGGELLAACELFLVRLSCFMFYFYSWHIHWTIHHCLCGLIYIQRPSE